MSIQLPKLRLWMTYKCSTYNMAFYRSPSNLTLHVSRVGASIVFLDSPCLIGKAFLPIFLMVNMSPSVLIP